MPPSMGQTSVLQYNENATLCFSLLGFPSGMVEPTLRSWTKEQQITNYIDMHTIEKQQILLYEIRCIKGRADAVPAYVRLYC